MVRTSESLYFEFLFYFRGLGWQVALLLGFISIKE